MPNAAPGLYTSGGLSQSPASATERWVRAARASRLVRKSLTTTLAATPQKSRLLAPFTVFLLRLALDAQPGVRQRVESLEPHFLAALMALAVFLRRQIETAQGLVHVPQVTALLRGKQELFLPLHRIRALIGHVEGVGGQIAVVTLERRIERLPVVAQLLHHPGPLFPESSFVMGHLFLVHHSSSIPLSRLL